MDSGGRNAGPQSKQKNKQRQTAFLTGGHLHACIDMQALTQAQHASRANSQSLSMSNMRYRYKWSKPSLAWRNKTIRDLVKTLGLAELTIIGELTPFTTPNQVKNTRRCITVSVYLHKCKYREFTPKCKPLVTLKNRKARLDFQRTTERVLRRKIETDPETSSKWRWLQ